MSRAQPVIDDIAVQRIVDAAAGCFFRHGYTGTTMRAIAAQAELSVGRLYEHFPSKQAILAEIVDAVHDALIAQTEAAVATAGDDAAARLEAAVWTQCEFYAADRCRGFVAHIEFRSLESENRARIAAKRRQLSGVVAEIIAEGVDQGVFDVDEPTAVSRALLSMCTAVASWQDVAEEEAPRHVAQTYCGLAERMTALRFGPAAVAAPRTAPPLAIATHA
jgi:AcrR family transcriptional regulator